MTAETQFLREQCFVNGAFIGKAEIEVNNPATGEVIGRIPRFGRAETASAIADAAAALVGWRARLANDRAVLLYRMYEAMMDHQEALGRLLTIEMGKPLREAKGEVAFAAGFFRWFGEEARRVYGDTIPSPFPGSRILVTRAPVGVVGAITPWNFPSSMIARKAAAALAAGCTVVAKPATQTPFSALAFGVLATEVGLPAGTLNVITGSAAAIASEMCENPLLRKVTFTGSTEVGKRLAAQALANMKRVSMELGGNAPFIVFNDADIDRAVDGAMAAKFRNAGQTCVCANRIYVQAGIYDAFAEKLAAATRALRLGDGLDPDTQQGPLIDMGGVAKVEEHIADAVAQGAKVLAGGKRAARGGSWFEPTVLAGVTANMLVARDETFGPLAPLFRFETEAEVIAAANATEYGLAAYFYTRDLGRAFRVSEALEYGMVGINEGLISTEVAPFGGVKESGLGREGSRYGLDDYTDLKYTLVGGL